MSTRKARPCTHCGVDVDLDDIVYSSAYPEWVPQVRDPSKFSRGTVKDAERVWCSAACAKATWAAKHL